MSYTIAPIVEGHGDVPAIRVLLNKVAPQLIVAKPVRQKRHQLVQLEGLKRAAAIAASNISDKGAILLLIDADADCAKTLGLTLQQQLKDHFSHLTTKVVLAVREFEAWIVGGDAQYNLDKPDSAGNLDERIRQVHGIYKKSVDQPRLTARIDPQRLRNNSRSFQKFLKVVEELERDAGHHDCGS